MIESNNPLFKEQELLKKLYECQDSMEELLDEGKDDIHYFYIGVIIKRLESHLQNNHDIL